MRPSYANQRTLSHAQSGLPTITFHFSAISSRDESIRAAQCSAEKWWEWFLPVKQASLLQSPHHFEIDSCPEVMGRVNGTDLSPVAASYLLWGREAAPHWLGWMSTSWRTPPPRPRHSRSHSMGKEEGHKPRHKAAERGTQCLLMVGETSSVNIWLRRRDRGEPRSCIVKWAVCFQLSVIITTRWQWSASFIKV